MAVRIIQSDALAALRSLPSESVQCVVTSPPYFGLRAYGTDPQVWGGDPEHGHEWRDGHHVIAGGGYSDKSTLAGFTSPTTKGRLMNDLPSKALNGVCPCGAWRGELGSEPTPALFIEHLVSIFDEVKRVLRPDGVAFVNLADSYSGSGKGPSGHNGIGKPRQVVCPECKGDPPNERGSDGWHCETCWSQGFILEGTQERRQGFVGSKQQTNAGSLHGANHEFDYRGIPAKNLLLVPQRFAIAMQDTGWIVRSQIAWTKTSAMPESVRDRPTSAWEPIWMFAKSARYYFDQDAVRQSPTQWAGQQLGIVRSVKSRAEAMGVRPSGNEIPGADANSPAAGANLRNVWNLSPEPLKEAHFASFPSEIPRRCILAGTSEKGACGNCGSPWVRVVERPDFSQQPKRKSDRWEFRNGDRTSAGSAWQKWRDANPDKQLGWQPSCPCKDAGPPIPQTILDPFLGSGTTALVADQLGRHAIGIELSPTYAEMARARIANDAPMLTADAVTVQRHEQAALFAEEAVWS